MDKNKSRRMFLGSLSAEPVYIIVNGYVLCQACEGEDDWYEECIISYTGQQERNCFIYGAVGSCGNALAIDEDDNLILFYPPDALDPPHEILGTGTQRIIVEDGIISIVQSFQDGEVFIRKVVEDESE
jgi:hypothetical protein